MSTKKQRISLKTWLAFVLYFFIPLSTLFLILQSYPELPSNQMYMRIYWVIPTAILLVILAQVSYRYQKGETKRFLLNIGFTVMTILWMVGLLGGGIVITTQWNDYAFSLHMHNYILLIITVAFLNVLYYIFEWMMYRKKQDSSFINKEEKTNMISE